jgi:hypothetical protein
VNICSDSEDGSSLSILQNVFISVIHALNNGQKISRHACALQVLPEVLSRIGVICLFEINGSSVHAARFTWLERACSMLEVP